MSKLERNLAWIYVNGAKGGGGSGGGETTEYTITVSEGSTVYTTTPNVTLIYLLRVWCKEILYSCSKKSKY